MATINSWLGGLIEGELSDIVSWQSVVKQEPGVPRVKNVGRFQDDGSNYRAIVTAPALGPDCKVQLLKAVELNAKGLVPVSDGETQIKARLSSDAWASYAKGLEGEDPMKGDILICRDLTIISTPFGPPDDQVQLMITQVGFDGVNARKTIGQPKPVLLRPGVQDLIAKTSQIRMQHYEDGWPAMADAVPEEDGANQSEVGRSIVPERALPVGSPHPHSEAGATSQLQTQQEAVSQSPADMNMMLQTQLPPAPTQPPTRNTTRRGRGGLVSMGTHGVEAAHGVNLAQPQAPGLPVTKGQAAETPGRRARTNKLLGLLQGKPSKGPVAEATDSVDGTPPAKKRKVKDQWPSKLTENRAKSPILQHPEPSVPVSAQIPPEPMVVDEPTQAVKSSRTKLSNPTTSASSRTRSERTSRKPHRIAADQRRLLAKKDCWIPSLPGQQFPHPNVPIELLKDWNVKAVAASRDAPEPTPQVPIEVSSELSSSAEESDHADRSSVVGAPKEVPAESELSSSDSDDEPFEWSPSQREKLPPDSSAQEGTSEEATVAQVGVASRSPRPTGSQPISNKRPNQSSEPVATPDPKQPALPSTPLRSTLRSAGRRDPRVSGRSSHAAAAPASGVSQATGTPAAPMSSESTPSKASTSQTAVKASPQGNSGPQTPSGSMPIRRTPQRVPETTQPTKAGGHRVLEYSPHSSNTSVASSRRVQAAPTWNGSPQGLRLSAMPSKSSPSNLPPGQATPSSSQGDLTRGSISQSSQSIPTGPRNPNLKVRRPTHMAGRQPSVGEQAPMHARKPHPLPPRPPSTAGDLRALSTEKPPRTLPWSSQPDPGLRPVNAQSPTVARPGRYSQQATSRPAASENFRHSVPSQFSLRGTTDSCRPPAGSADQRRGSWHPDHRANDPNRPLNSQPDSSGDLQMAPPRALQAFEDNDLRAARSEFYRGAMRKGWLATQLTEESAKNYELEPLLQAYRAATPKDPATSDDFRRAIEELFPDATEAGSILKTSANHHSEAAQRDETLASRDVWRETRYGKEVAEAYPRGSTPEEARQAYQQREVEVDAMAATQLPTQSNVSPVNLFEIQQSKKQRTTNTSGIKAASAGKESATKVNGSTEERAIQTSTTQEQQQIPEPPSVFSEFAQAWKRTGAFTRAKGTRNQKYRPPRQGRTLNVLGWAFGE